jgi:receptor-type tyrosine-protein phosphatase zeta
LRNGTVYFRNVELGDTTNLQCEASNTHGYVFADVYLNVLMPQTLSSVRQPPEVTYASEQQTTTITRQTSASPPTRVMSMSDGRQVTDERFATQTNGGMYMTTLRVTDSVMVRHSSAHHIVVAGGIIY